MSKTRVAPSFIQVLYLLILFFLLSLIVSTPILVTESVTITKNFIIDEEYFEAFLVIILLILSFITLNYYRNEVIKVRNEKRLTEEKLNDAFNYIGQTNVQIQEIKSIFNQIDKYPETKNDFKKILQFLGERVLSIVNVQWVLFRIINTKTTKTINEHMKTRNDKNIVKYPNISNKRILQNQNSSTYISINSNSKDLNIVVCCIFPQTKIKDEEKVLLQAISNQIVMFFIILKSNFYKDEN